MSSYVVIVGNAKPVRVKNFRGARSVIAETVANLMARDPEAGARAAMTVNEMIETGAAEHSLTAHGRWSTTVTMDGELVQLAVIKKRW